MAKQRFIDDVDWSRRARTVVQALGAYFVKDLAKYSQEEVLRAPDADSNVLAEIERELKSQGLALKPATHARSPAIATPDDSEAIHGPDRIPEYDWGCLYVREPDGDDIAVTAMVVEAYRAAGLSMYTALDLEELRKHTGFDALPPLEINESETLTADDVLVEPDRDGWTVVRSLRFEWARLGQHPLALAISRQRAVLSITSIAGRYGEISWYDKGKLQGISLMGTLPPKRPEGVPSLTLKWFDTASVPVTELERRLRDPKAFITAVGPEEFGYRDLFATMSFDEVDPQRYLVFRPRRS